MARTKEQRRKKIPPPPPPPPPCSSAEDSSDAKEHDDDVNSQQVGQSSRRSPKIPIEIEDEDSDADLMLFSIKPAGAEASLSAAKASSPSKRAADEENNPSDSKRARRDIDETTDQVKKQHLFQRVWSYEDEIALLNSAIKFKIEKKVDPLADLNLFFEFCSEIGFTKIQLKDKLKRLNKRYSNNQRRGKDGQFKQVHDQNVFDLSKEIWATDDDDISEAAEPIQVTKEKMKVVGVGSIEEVVLYQGYEMIGESERTALEERWRKLRIAELELFLIRNQLVSEQTKALLDVYKSINDN